MLIDGFSMMAFVAATEPLRIANRLLDQSAYEWSMIGAGRPNDAVVASNGMRVLPDAHMTTIETLPWLAVCSGFRSHVGSSTALYRWLARLDRQATTLGGIDTGCFALAEAGLLDGQVVTLHWESLPAFRERFSAVTAVESLYETGDRRFSCAGGMAATDMMLADIRQRHGAALAAAVAEQLIHARARVPDSRQRRSLVERLNSHDPVLVRAVALMESHIESPLSLAEIARRAGRSPRAVERAFQAALGCSPGAHYRALRLARARDLLRATDRSMTDIALACGFSSPARFSRVFKNHVGVAPSAWRRADQPAKK